MAVAVGVAFPLVLLTGQRILWLLMVLCGFMGVLFISSVPLMFDYACDVFYPSGEAQITGCLNSSGNILGAVMVKILEYRLV